VVQNNYDESHLLMKDEQKPSSLYLKTFYDNAQSADRLNEEKLYLMINGQRASKADPHRRTHSSFSICN
jgi:hypothetical protein